MITIDFETEAIEGNPIHTPPRPVGVAIQIDNDEPIYTADFTPLYRIWESNEPLLFHNAPFDLSVASKHLGLPLPPWERVHDTLYSIFLKDPYAKSLSLKPSAETYLGEPPEEQDELHEWIVRNVVGATRKNAGAFICEAPFELVAKYAKGDVHRTKALHDKLYPDIPTGPYDRERRLAPILMEGTRRGIRVDHSQLGQHIAMYEAALERASDAIRQLLGQGPGFNPGSGAELAAALSASGLGPSDAEWKRTPTGRRSTKKDYLMDVIKDPELKDLILYRSSLSTCLGTFMIPWAEKASGDGRVHPEWNAVRGEKYGTRTGRLSSSNPNFQNVPTEFNQQIPPGYPPLPYMRQYVQPEEGHVWVKRDFSSQEIRILAHFEEGELCQKYNDDPDLDPHAMAQGIIKDNTNITYPRKDVKITGFSIVYGSGVPGLSQQLHRPHHEAAAIKSAYLAAMPGVGKLQRGVSRRGQMGQSIRTWGGRHYYAEPPKIINGRSRDFSYKLLNYLIQGSGADQTKEVICDWYDQAPAGDVFMATVHDEINISAPEDTWRESMECLRECMEQNLFDVPMKSEGFMGINWHEIEEIK